MNPGCEVNSTGGQQNIEQQNIIQQNISPQYVGPQYVTPQYATPIYVGHQGYGGNQGLKGDSPTTQNDKCTSKWYIYLSSIVMMLQLPISVMAIIDNKYITTVGVPIGFGLLNFLLMLIYVIIITKYFDENFWHVKKPLLYSMLNNLFALLTGLFIAVIYSDGEERTLKFIGKIFSVISFMFYFISFLTFLIRYSCCLCLCCSECTNTQPLITNQPLEYDAEMQDVNNNSNVFVSKNDFVAQKDDFSYDNNTPNYYTPAPISDAINKA